MSTDRAKPDLLFVHLVHQALRADGTRLRATVSALEPGDRGVRLDGVQAYYDSYRQQLVSHHTHEDELFFPALAAAVGDDQTHVTELVAQHHELDDVLVAVGTGLAALASSDADFISQRTVVAGHVSSMVEHLTTHLDLEERTALPLYEANISVSEHKRLESDARRITPKDETKFLIPWLVEHASEDQRKAFFRSVPPLRIVYRLNRRRYRDLDAALLPAT